MHLNCKNCKEIQQKINNYDELFINHKRNINELRSNLRMGLDKSEENIT